MKITNLKQQKFSQLYNIQATDIFNHISELKFPFGSKLCIVTPNNSSTIHNHHENECFFITKGSGIITIDNQTHNVQENDVIIIPPFKNHIIANNTGTDLEFITIWWEDLQNISREFENSKIQSEINSNLKEYNLIFSTPPTPNGDLHLGHLSGPYTGADIYKRYLQMHSKQAFHITGRDDNQSYVLRKAINQNKLPHDLADEYSDKMLNTLKDNQIELDYYGEPKKIKSHVDIVTDTVVKLYNKGLIFVKEDLAPFCQETGNYLYEAHIRGECPHCGAESDGCACEQCGQPNNCVDLINPISKYGQKVIFRQAKRLHFKFNAFENQLKDYVKQANMPSHTLSMCLKMLENGLSDICISHISDWGIPLPHKITQEISELQNQTIYVWFEMASGYLSASQELRNKLNIDIDFYKNDNAEIVHFFGFDNSYFHTLLFPAIFMALDENINIPNNFIVNELLNLDGLKFSTSRGHLIWGIDLLKLVPSDYLRYYLCIVRPQTSKTNFTLEHFKSSLEENILDKWRNCINKINQLLKQEFNNQIPYTGAWNKEQQAFYLNLQNTYKQAQVYYSKEHFSTQDVIYLANNLIQQTINFLNSGLHLVQIKSAYDLLRTSASLLILSLKVLASIMNPIMPSFAKQLWNAIYTHDDKNILWENNLEFVTEQTINLDSTNDYWQNIPNQIFDLYKKVDLSLNNKINAQESINA